MLWVGFEPTISAGERPKTYALDRTATGTGQGSISEFNIQGQQQKERTLSAALCGLFLPFCQYKYLNPQVSTKLLELTFGTVGKFHNIVFISGDDGPGQLLRLYDG